MKLTKQQLKQIIQEELNAVLLLERITEDEANAAKRAIKAIEAINPKLNPKWDALRDKLPETAPSKSRPIRDGLWNIWRKGWYSTIKAVYDEASKSKYCCSYVPRLLEEASEDLKGWIYSNETDPQRIDHALNKAIRKAVLR